MLKTMTALQLGGARFTELLAAVQRERAVGAMTTGRRGLVVSEVIRQLRGDLAHDAFVEAWWGTDVPATGDGTVVPAEIEATRWVTREHVLKRPTYEPAPDRRKVVGTAYRRADFDRPAFFRYWETVHAPVSAKVPGLGAYVVSEVLPSYGAAGEVDAFVEQWWPDEATLAATTDSPELEVAWADVANYARTTGSFWLVREHVFEVPVYDAPGLLEA